jgi:putative PIN family toxin of toxin-antitoxin system
VRVFLDTNVLVAAFATRGLCADVLRDVLAEHELLVGEVVLTELQRALTRRLRLPETAVEEILEFLREHEVVPKPRKPASFPVRDPADRWILASAIAAQAPLRILDPRAFWELLRKRH